MSAIALNNPLIPSAGIPPANWLFATMAPDGTQLYSCTLAAIASAVAPILGATNHTITYVIDGGGSAIDTGVSGQLSVSFGATINSVTLLADQTGSVVVDIWKVPFSLYPGSVSNTICASDLPTIASAQKYEDSGLAGWTVDIVAGDTLMFNVNSASTITRLTIALGVTAT